MGRGRAKAKQTKVARQLKYGAVHSDLGALQAELSGAGRSTEPTDEDIDELEDDDPYAAYVDDDEDDEPVRRAR